MQTARPEEDKPAEAEPRRAKLEQRDGKAGPYWALVASNGETLMVSEAYSSKASHYRAREDVIHAMDEVVADEIPF